MRKQLVLLYAGLKKIGQILVLCGRRYPTLFSGLQPRLMVRNYDLNSGHTAVVLLNIMTPNFMLALYHNRNTVWQYLTSAEMQGVDSVLRVKSVMR